ncbi:MAG: NAD(P)H-dependent oxidoreductase [Roseiflexaceae bacterium]|nr:NAD(P)H-dependent oxidoreductase [Roseiflexaceae bacterium]
MHILAISGSLRATSSNTTLLKAAAALAPAGVAIALYDRLGDLPHFNPDLDDIERGIAPPAVLAFRALLNQADGVLICSPEYAHGVPGTLKNALDWVVSSGELLGKPVALLKASRATYAHAALKETLSVILAQIVDEEWLSIPLPGNRVDLAGLLAHAEIPALLGHAMAAFVHTIHAGRSETSS